GSSRSLVPVVCILCAEVGHSVFDHPSLKIPTKFPDGKPAWSTLSNSCICTSEGREICVKFNTKGKDCCEGICTHDSTCLHICSFCGSKGHHTFAWNCCSKPSY
ncbi:hypothetical protein P691DRAFT_682111, partial [Macrolepiota fuliginosa MF-IS2]